MTESALVTFWGATGGLVLSVWARQLLDVLTPAHITLDDQWWRPATIGFALVLWLPLRASSSLDSLQAQIPELDRMASAGEYVQAYDLAARIDQRARLGRASKRPRSPPRRRTVVARGRRDRNRGGRLRR